MMMEKLNIDLTPAEQALLDQIEMDAVALKHEHWRRNGDLVVELFRSLTDRHAIPDHRRKYFTDPEFNLGGRGSSRLQEFQRSQCSGEDILRHAHFLTYLNYFIHGPRLPASVISQFRQAVSDCGMVTSSDIGPLGKQARQLARGQRLEPKKAAEEFYKLALDLGLSTTYAPFIHKAVQQIRYN